MHEHTTHRSYLHSSQTKHQSKLLLHKCLSCFSSLFYSRDGTRNTELSLVTPIVESSGGFVQGLNSGKRHFLKNPKPTISGWKNADPYRTNYLNTQSYVDTKLFIVIVETISSVHMAEVRIPNYPVAEGVVLRIGSQSRTHAQRYRDVSFHEP
jgi:hypothetical protein